MPILFLITFISMMGFGAIFPLFPLFKVKFSLNDIELGYIISISAFFSLIGSLFLGWLSDKIGRKLPLALPMFGLAISYYFTATADNITSFFILRILSGFFIGNFAVAFASASDMSTPQTRIKYMGLIGGSFGLGFVFGPAIGGYFAGGSNNISSIDFATPFNISAFSCLFVGFLCLFFFKETLLPNERKIKIDSDNIFKQLKKLFINNEFLFFTIIALIFNTLSSGIQVFLGIYLNISLDYTPRDIGFYWGIYGILMSLTQIFFTKYFNTKKALIYGFLSYGISVGLLSFATNTYWLILPTLGMVLSFAIIGPNINTNLSLQGEKNQQGIIFGINQSFGSIGRILGPNLLAFIYYYNHNIIWFCVSIVCLITSIAIYLHINKKK